MEDEMGVLIPRRQIADREGVTVRSIERYQATDPTFPKSVIRNGRHFFDSEEYEEYRRARSAAPQIRRTWPGNRRADAKAAEPPPDKTDSGIRP
jgi:hypothetical protein